MSSDAARSWSLIPSTRSAAHSAGVGGVGVGVGDGAAAASLVAGGAEAPDVAHPASIAAPSTVAATAATDLGPARRRTRGVYAARLDGCPSRRVETGRVYDDPAPGPDREVLRRHAADATLMAGGAAAILLQLADPRVAAGVARHSGFRDRPLDRLVGTHAYLTALVFGEERDIRHVSRIVDARHARVRGDAEHPHRPAYDARDADAQRWVAATLLAVALDLEERLRGSPLDEATADALVRGYAPIAARLQGAPAGWPETRAEFDDWWDGRVSRLDIGDDARSVARDLLAGTGLPPALVPLMLPVRLITAALLPPVLRAAYGMRWTPRVERTATGWLAALAVLRRVAPASVRAIPTAASLRRVRRRSRYAEGDLRGRG
jgi:uncharacterized protein (DUF2236 family)